jgi:hypothetical protein
VTQSSLLSLCDLINIEIVHTQVQMESNKFAGILIRNICFVIEIFSFRTLADRSIILLKYW